MEHDPFQQYHSRRNKSQKRPFVPNSVRNFERVVCNFDSLFAILFEDFQ